ncbi:UNVERIFIED_CONTAM: hypothetical protein HDU68_008187 [Siphonaria sp. JEL0065]|nr:hypothetical protein HDU68_008187 [Siphonaria sp. JEL0065]
MCLRYIFSCGRGTSLAAMHLIGAVLPIENRNLFVNASFLHRLHHSTDSRNLTAYTYHKGINHLYPPNTSSLIAQSIWQNPLWNSASLHEKQWKILTIEHPLAPNNSVPCIIQLGSNNRKIAEDKIDETQKLLPVPGGHLKHHALVQAGSEITRGVARSILLWLLGAIATHQDCIKCNSWKGLSRSHAVECSGVLLDLLPITGPAAALSADDEALGATLLDNLVRDLTYTREDLAKTRAIAAAIDKIRVDCAGYKATYDASSATAQEEVQFVLGDNVAPHEVGAVESKEGDEGEGAAEAMEHQSNQHCHNHKIQPLSRTNVLLGLVAEVAVVVADEYSDGFFPSRTCKSLVPGAATSTYSLTYQKP